MHTGLAACHPSAYDNYIIIEAAVITARVNMEPTVKLDKIGNCEWGLLDFKRM
ncbi:MAG TPA: hypothetical protein VH684_13650 [Xanthobacteraceae bacterium]